MSGVMVLALLREELNGADDILAHKALGEAAVTGPAGQYRQLAAQLGQGVRVGERE